MPFDSYDMYMLSGKLMSVDIGSRHLDRQIAHLFSRSEVNRWTTNMEAAATLFKEEFPDWSRSCLSNSCQGIYCHLYHDDDNNIYGAVAETDALALCAAMVKAKRKERIE